MFCSHEYEQAFPRLNPAQQHSRGSRPATGQGGGVTNRRSERWAICVPLRNSYMQCPRCPPSGDNTMVNRLLTTTVVLRIKWWVRSVGAQIPAERNRKD